jgi:hypothetical protein
MKNNILLTLPATLIIITCSIWIPGGLIFLVASLMALSIILLIYGSKSRVMKITRWAKENPQKAQWLIAIVELILLGLGIITGYNLKKLGFEFSGSIAFMFSAILVVGFLSVPFRQKQYAIAIPKEINRNRIAYLGISLSSFILVCFAGNKIGDLYPNSPIIHVIETIDQAIFSDKMLSLIGTNEAMIGGILDENSNEIKIATASAKPIFAVMVIYDKEKIESAISGESVHPLNIKKAKKKAERKAKKQLRKNLRRAFSAGSCALAVVLILLLIIVACAGICLFVGGVAGLASGAPALGVVGVLSGPFIFWGAIKGIGSLAKWCKR